MDESDDSVSTRTVWNPSLAMGKSLFTIDEESTREVPDAL